MSPPPSHAESRRFFCTAYAKTLAGQPLEPIETLASLWIAEHPEYHPDLEDAEAAIDRSYDDANPFMHLAMHLTLSEQCSIDQPRGIRQAIDLLTRRRDSLHAAHHEAMECLTGMLWNSLRTKRPPDSAAYIDCVQRRATRD